MSDTSAFWESRAARFAGEGQGLRAVCSFAMPSFYNWSIDFTQRAALRGLIDDIGTGTRILDYGCGVGRWSRALARRGARVTGVDFSKTMIEQAALRTRSAGLETSCEFIQADVGDLDLGRKFDLVFGVTVLQHVLGEERLIATVERLARHLEPGARLIMLEAAPTNLDTRADTETFRARTSSTYRRAIEAAGLRVEEIRGVDPVPLKLWLVPRFRRWPRSLASLVLHAATACSLPLDLALARPLSGRSWHKIIVARAPEALR